MSSLTEVNAGLKKPYLSLRISSKPSAKIRPPALVLALRIQISVLSS